MKVHFIDDCSQIQIANKYKCVRSLSIPDIECIMSHCLQTFPAGSKQQRARFKMLLLFIMNPLLLLCYVM